MANFTTLVPNKPFFVENLTGANGGAEILYSAADFREYTAAVNRREGVLGPGDFWVQQADNVGYAIKVLKGSAICGKYLVTLIEDLPINVSFANNPGTTCVHKVYLVVNDEAYNANTVGYEAQIQGMESVNGAIPPLPTFSAGYIELCSITYKPNQPYIQNKDIANTAPHGGGGSVIPLASYISPGYQSTTSGFRATVTNGAVFLAGGISKTSGFISGSENIVATLPATIRPKSGRILIGATATYQTSLGPPLPTFGRTFHTVGVASDGTVTTSLPGSANPASVYFDGITYQLD